MIMYHIKIECKSLERNVKKKRLGRTNADLLQKKTSKFIMENKEIVEELSS